MENKQIEIAFDLYCDSKKKVSNLLINEIKKLINPLLSKKFFFSVPFELDNENYHCNCAYISKDNILHLDGDKCDFWAEDLSIETLMYVYETILEEINDI